MVSVFCLGYDGGGNEKDDWKERQSKFLRRSPYEYHVDIYIDIVFDKPTFLNLSLSTITHIYFSFQAFTFCAIPLEFKVFNRSYHYMYLFSVQCYVRFIGNYLNTQCILHKTPIIMKDCWTCFQVIDNQYKRSHIY